MNMFLKIKIVSKNIFSIGNKLFNEPFKYFINQRCGTFWMIDWCLMPTFAEF